MNSFLKRLTLVVMASVAVASCSDNGNSPTGPGTVNKSARRAAVAECGEATYLAALSSALPAWEDSIETWKGNAALLNTAPAYSGQSTADYLTALVPVLQQWEASLDTVIAPAGLDSVVAFNAATSNRQTYLTGLSSLLASWETTLETSRGTDFLATPPTFVADTSAPEITCPADTTIGCAPDSGVAFTFVVTALDDCDSDSVVVTSVPASGSLFPIGETVVTSTAVDSLGNESSCTFTVTVTSGSEPVITCPSDTTITCAPDSGIVFTFVATATGGCNSTPVVTSVPASGSLFPVGETVVTSTAVDSLTGAESSCTFTVTVEGGSEPELTCPDDITVHCAPEEGVAVEFEVTASGGCGGSEPTVTSEPASGSIFPIGETTVTSTALDSQGNETSCTFTVTVEAEESGEITDAHASPNVLWPPNHRWVDIRLDVDVDGGCTDGDDISWTVTRVTSNEAVNGNGDGNTSPDWIITDDGVKLRAERSGTGNGRIYTIYFEGDDGSEGSVRVRVPHDRGH